MDGPTQPPPFSEQQSDSNLRPILIGVILVVVIVGIVALLSHQAPKGATGPPPYTVNIKLTDLKMSAAENFVGASVTYIDGTVTNAGNQTVTHAMVHVVFKNSLGEIAQVEDVPLRVLQTGGPYVDAVDLGISRLAPGQSKSFRLTFEHVTADWNQAYPELQVTDVNLK